jgi:hypothetical protein
MANDLNTPDRAGIFLGTSLRNEEPIIIRLEDGSALFDAPRRYPGRSVPDDSPIMVVNRTRFICFTEPTPYQVPLDISSGTEAIFFRSSRAHINPFDLKSL